MIYNTDKVSAVLGLNMIEIQATIEDRGETDNAWKHIIADYLMHYFYLS